jgi:alkylation response protein AidB-like acyl-CoA dehydrogenase
MTESSVVTRGDDLAEWLGSLRRWAAGAQGTPAAWREAAAQGLLSVAVPEDKGGAGAGYEAACLAIEAVARESGMSGLSFALSAQMWAVQEPLIAFGAAPRHAGYLTGMLEGAMVGALAATEYESGSDLLSLRTRAEALPDGRWRLNGAKTFVTNGPSADVFLIIARTADGSPLTSLTAFAVERGAPGLAIGPPAEKAGLRGAEIGSLLLTDCDVDESAALGGIGAGFAVLMHAMRYERAFILAGPVGLMGRALQRAIEHARSRSQFGSPLSSYDTVRQRLVRMYLSLTSARETLLTTSRTADNGKLDHVRSSVTKLHISTEFSKFCQELADMYGGYAILPETGIVDLIAEATASRAYSGTSDMQMKIIAEGMGL